MTKTKINTGAAVDPGDRKASGTRDLHIGFV